MMLLNSRKILITGSTGDIGSTICEVLLQNGAFLFLTSTSDEKLEKLKEQLLLKFPSKEKNIFYQSCDLQNEEDICKLVDTAAKKMSGIDVLIGNAGITDDCLAIKMTKKQWDRVINVNLTSNFILSRECLKTMVKQRSGKIINISSIIGLKGNEGQINYSASKAGLIAMTKTLAKEYARFGITANCIAPGFIETSMTNKLMEQKKKEILKKIALERFGKTIDVANVCLFLSSNLSDYITGQTISVDGYLSI